MVLNSLLSEIYFEKTESFSLPHAERFKELASQHLTLNLQYQLFASTLDELLKNQPSKPFQNNLFSQDFCKQFRLQTQAAYRLGEILISLYQDYLSDPHEAARIQAQQQIYAELLQGPALEEFSKDASFVRKVRTNTAEANLYRLLFVRSKRAADILASFNLLSQTQNALLMNFNYYANPILMTLSWLYFAPRLAVNAFLLMKHGIKGPWMGTQEGDLPWKTRVSAQLQQCWFELGNDLVWFSAGCLTHLAWFGLLPPVSIYLTLAFFVYDLVASGVRFYLEMSRLNNLAKAYEGLGHASQEIKDLKHLLEKALNKQVLHDLLRLSMHLGITTAIVLCIACALPVFATNPLIPVVGAIGLALLCVVNFIAAEINNTSRPETKISASSLGFFKRNVALPLLDVDSLAPSTP